MRWRWTRLGVWSGLFAGSVGLAGGCAHSKYAECGPDGEDGRPFLQARAAVQNPLAAQAVNGAVLEATVWNYHFRPEYLEEQKVAGPNGIARTVTRRRKQPEPTDDLLPGGVALVQRLARRETGPVLRVYLQTAHDFRPTRLDDPKAPEHEPARVFAERDKFNRDRIQEIRERVAAVRPDLHTEVVVIDPDEVGMPGKEAQTGLAKFFAAPRGELSRDAVLGTDIGGATSLFGGLTGGQIGGAQAGQAPPVIEPTKPPAPGAAPTGLPAGGDQ